MEPQRARGVDGTMLSRRSLFALPLLPFAAACQSHEASARASASVTTAPPSPPDPARVRWAALLADREKLRPLHERSGPPKPGEWRYEHPETGQTFEEYARSRPTVPTPERRTLVVQPLGPFDEAQAKILALATDYLGRYFGLPTRRAESIPLSAVPTSAKRVHPTWGGKQILSQWVIDALLGPKLPADAAALIAFTTEDLWPGGGWNFVFGQADLHKRVGAWSLHRYGDPSKGEGAFKETLRRALKVAVHETGHMFSLEHCTAYRCVQAGINSLDEEDRSPLWACPECVTKIVWATKADHIPRYEKLAAFCKEAALSEEAAFFERSIAALRADT